jgi:polyisoprenoid-binding protein YceI
MSRCGRLPRLINPRKRMMKTSLALCASMLVVGTAVAAPVTYQIDPGHTYPSFEADHLGGLSVWRGKMTKTSGTIVLDTQNKTGSVDITVDAATIDFGHEKLNERAKSPDMFDVAKFPAITYKGALAHFNGGAPTEVDGELTMHGVTKPLKLTLNQFKCMQNPVTKKDVCGADASGTLDRSAFGIDYDAKLGFKQEVKLQIQVEAIRAS